MLDVQDSVGTFLALTMLGRDGAIRPALGRDREGLTSGLASELGPDGDIHLEHRLQLDHELQPKGGGHLEVGGRLPEDCDVAWGERGLRKQPALGLWPSEVLGARQGLRTYESCMVATWCSHCW